MSILFILLVFQGVPVGFPADPAMGLPNLGPSAMVEPTVPPASSCSGQMPVGNWCLFYLEVFLLLGYYLVLIVLLSFQAPVHPRNPGYAVSLEEEE